MLDKLSVEHFQLLIPQIELVGLQNSKFHNRFLYITVSCPRQGMNYKLNYILLTKNVLALFGIKLKIQWKEDFLCDSQN